MTTKKRLIFYADPEIEAWLKEAQVKTGASQGEIIRRAIRLQIFSEKQTRKSK